MICVLKQYSKCTVDVQLMYRYTKAGTIHYSGKYDRDPQNTTRFLKWKKAPENQIRSLFNIK